VRVFSDDRDAREALLARVCADLDCAAVQHLGKVFVLWRPNPEKEKKPAPAPAARTKQRGDHFTRGLLKKAGPRTPVDPVRERRRIAQGEGVDARSGKGRRGAARHEPLVDERVVAAPATPAAATRKKSSYTPRTKPKSFSAKPNPRSAWEKKPAAANATGTRRRRARG